MYYIVTHAMLFIRIEDEIVFVLNKLDRNILYE